MDSSPRWIGGSGAEWSRPCGGQPRLGQQRGLQAAHGSTQQQAAYSTRHTGAARKLKLHHNSPGALLSPAPPPAGR